MRITFILRRLSRSLAAGLLAGGLAAAGLFAWRSLQPAITVAGEARAVDGDSLRLDGRDIRLAGIDAPELRQTCLGPRGEEPCGRQARDVLARLVAAGPAECTIVDRDRYERDVALCRVAGRDVNADMVRQGHAIAFGRFEAEEAEARAGRRGVWATRFERPADWRVRHPRSD